MPPLTRARMVAALSAPVVSRTPHFALQHQRAFAAPVAGELSTEDAPHRSDFVDNHGQALVSGLGLVVPKRHARRAVTRNLIRRQMREAARCGALAEGAWVVRLRAPFESHQYPSASSAALRHAVRGELDQLFGRLHAP